MVNKKLVKLLKTKERRIKKKERELDYRSTYVATIIGALTFTAGLFWRDAINGFLNLLPESQSVIGKIASAIILSGMFVFIVVKMDAKVKEDRRNLEVLRKQLEQEKFGIKK